MTCGFLLSFPVTFRNVNSNTYGLVREDYWHSRRFLVPDDRGAPRRQQSASSNSDSILRLACDGNQRRDARTSRIGDDH